MIVDYLKWLRQLSKKWDLLDWVIAPFVIPVATLGLVLIYFLARLHARS